MALPHDVAISRRLLRHARPCWPHLAAIFALQLIGAPLALLLPLPLKIAVDTALGRQPLPHIFARFVPATWSLFSAGIVVATVFGVLIAILVHLHGVICWILQTYTGERLVLEFRSEVFRHAQRLTVGYHDERGAADTVYRIQDDATSIQYVAVQGWIPLLSAAIMLVTMLIVTARIDFQLALVAVAISPALFVLSRASSNRLRTRWHLVKELDASAMGVVQEVLAALRVVKAFGQEERESRRFVRQQNLRMWGQVRLAATQAIFYLLIGLTIACGSAAALYVGVVHVRTGLLTLGQLLLVMAYMAQLYEPLRTMSSKLPDIQGWITSVERVFHLLDMKPRIIDRPDACSLDRATGDVNIENVTFAYNEHDGPVVQDVSLKVTPGTRIGIVGATGSGKTTLMTLLSRFYDPTAGRILLDGVDIRDYRLDDLRRQFAIVLQDPVLFAGSIAANIAYARPTATREEVVVAAQAANVHDFIVTLPDGYDTKVGERGMRLSGGQRQRISIARAFLKDSPVLIMDEPTSSVDVHTEAGIMESMERLMSGRTTFMIAHRLSTLESCDMLLLLERGSARIIREDIHEFLQLAPQRLNLSSPQIVTAAASQ